MKVTINLGDRRETAHGLPGVEIVNRNRAPWVQVNDRRWPLWIVERASKLPSGLASAVPPSSIGLVLGAQIPAAERHALEADGLAWWDLRGAFHLEHEDVLIHVDTHSRPRAVAPRTDRTLGPVGVRVAQFLVEGEREHEWSVSALAALSGSSVGQAHNVLDLLEQERLVRATRAGASKRRVVPDRGRLLDWLGVQERRLRAPSGAYTSLYAANEVQLMHRFHDAAERAGVVYAVTSTVGARFRRVPVTTSAIARVRVDASDLEDVLTRLDLPLLDPAERGRGANLELWPDTGRVGTFARMQLDDVYVAPRARIWLDLMRQGGRNADGADLLKEQILERP